MQLPSINGLQEGAKSLVETARGIFASYPGVDGDAVEPGAFEVRPLLLAGKLVRP